MKFYIINGSPRRNYNTAKMLESAKNGIAETIKELKPEEKVEIETLNIVSMNFNGCKSCFNCKKIDGKYYGKCPTKDELTDYLEDIWMCDGVIIGSPIYFRDVTGQTRNFIERFLFPKFVYGAEAISPKRMPTGLIFTMNVTKEIYEQAYEDIPLALSEFMETVFTKPYIECAFNTYQFNDYSKYENYIFSEEEKRQYQEEFFPQDLDNAYNMGAKIAKDSLK